jgi:tripartite-type tricarboxylate transporter receptor subunit TctC
MPPGVTQDQVNFYIDLFKKVQALPEWKKFSEDAAFNATTLTGKEYVDWLTKAEATHKSLMQDAGFIAK